MFLEIITPEKKVFAGDVNSVQLPGTEGEFQILNNHAPIISTLQKGKVKVKDSNGLQAFEINSGVVEVLKNKNVLLMVAGLSLIIGFGIFFVTGNYPRKEHIFWSITGGIISFLFLSVYFLYMRKKNK